VVVPFMYTYKQIGEAVAGIGVERLSPRSRPLQHRPRGRTAAQAAAPAEPAAAETPEAVKPAERAPLPDKASREKASELVEEALATS